MFAPKMTNNFSTYTYRRFSWMVNNNSESALIKLSNSNKI